MKIFTAYSHDDESFRIALAKQFSVMTQQGLVTEWHDRKLRPGDDWHARIRDELEGADIVLLLVSASFLASDYCRDVEMKRALERAKSGLARVIPVIVRPCEWLHSELEGLQAVPRDGRAVSTWSNQDEAYIDIVGGVRAVVTQQPPTKRAPSLPVPQTAPTQANRPSSAAVAANSVNLGARITDRDVDRFLMAAFDQMFSFFSDALTHLLARDPQLDGEVARINSSRFTAVIYDGGRRIAECSVFLNRTPMTGIFYSTDMSSTNAWNEQYTAVEHQGEVSLKSLGMLNIMTGSTRTFLSPTEAALQLFTSLTSRLRRR